MSFISEHRNKVNVPDSQVKEVSAEEMYHSQPHIAKDRWNMCYNSFTMKPRSRDVPKYIPENPDCTTCNDEGFVWVELSAGRKKTVKCACKNEIAYN